MNYCGETITTKIENLIKIDHPQQRPTSSSSSTTTFIMGSKASRHKSTSNKKSLADHSCYYAVQTNSTTQHSFSVRFVEDEDEHTANNNSIKSTSSWMELFESTPAFILDCCSLRNDFTNSFENSEFKSYPSIRKVLSGSRHLFIWMEDDEEMSQTLVTRKTTTTTTCRMNAKDENDHFDDKVLIKVCHALFACGGRLTF